MTDLDTRMDLRRMRDLQGRFTHPWIRRALLMVLGVPVVLALAGLFGQPTQVLTAAGAGARLRIELPDVLRGGLLWRGQIAARASRTIRHPQIVLGRDFVTGMQLNTIEPSADSESNRGSDLVLSYPELRAGDELVVYVQLQVDPTTLGGQDTTVELDDGGHRIARVTHTITVLP